MNENIFEIYEFVRDNDLETHCYEYEDKDNEIVVFVQPWSSRGFLECIGNNAQSALDDGGYEIVITSDGYLGVELLKIIDMYCHNEESVKWFNRFKKYSSENC